MPASLSAKGLCCSFGATVVLDDVTFSLADGSRIGVLGPNGVGKSTLLRILAGESLADSGTVRVVPSSATIGYVQQERGDGGPELAIDSLARRTGIAAATEAMETAAVALGAGGAGVEDRYADALERWLALGGADFDSRAVLVAGELGLDEALLQRRIDELSGGEAARVSLGAILLSRYDFVLLDEPTNDLDFDGLDRLEQFLLARTGGLLVVSHDRAFLERTVNSVLEIDEHSHRASMFEGGWLAYQGERAVSRRHAEEDYATYRSRSNELADRARRQRDWATTGARKTARKAPDHDTAQRDFRMNRTEKQASKVRITERAIQRLETVEKPWESWQLNYRIATTGRSGDIVTRLAGAMVHRGEFELGPIDLEIAWGQRTAIVGPNGSGKTTLLEAVLGRLELDAGTRYFGPSVVVGELDQQRLGFPPERTLAEGFGQLVVESGMVQSEIRSLLAKFGLSGEHVDRPAGTLSPGERTRAGLAVFAATGVNCLVLDEPTNHLDVPAIEQLEEALQAWDATLLLVTHDRQFLESVPIDVVIGPDGHLVAPGS